MIQIHFMLLIPSILQAALPTFPTLYYIILYYIILNYIILYYIILYYIVLYNMYVCIYE